MKEDEPIVREYCASRTVAGWHAIVGDAVSEILSSRLLQQTRGLPAANLLCQTVATGIPEDWAPLPDRLEIVQSDARKAI